LNEDGNSGEEEEGVAEEYLQVILKMVLLLLLLLLLPLLVVELIGIDEVIIALTTNANSVDFVILGNIHYSSYQH